MPEYWLKALGMGARDQQMPDDWRNIKVLTEHATFRRNSSLMPGDSIVYYAAGKGLLFAEGEVTSSPYRFEEEGTESNWPWRVDVDIASSVDFIPRGAPVEDASVNGRNLKRSIRQKSHIRLSEAEYLAAVDAIRARANRESSPSRERLEQLIASGEVTPGKPLDRPLNPLPATGPVTASEALERDRAEN